jgi:DNA-binding GntR family transcriptional regulator
VVQVQREREPIADQASNGVPLRQLSHQLYEVLRAKILRRELAPGERVPLRELAQAFGVSMTPVRDAVNSLAADGLVVVSPRRGTIVAPLSQNDVRELYQVRMMLEPAAAEIAAESLSDDELRDLVDLADQLEQASAETYQDVDAYLHDLALDDHFHASIVRGVRNRRLNALYLGLQTNLIVARAIFPVSYRRRVHRLGEHRRILDALLARDGARAREETASHLRLAREDILRHMRTFDQATETDEPFGQPPDAQVQVQVQVQVTEP